jgi:pantetheine-phosphate adenylyltransferase
MSVKNHRVGVYAGSFDPPTIGHIWMIEQGVFLFDKLIIAIGSNPDKRYSFSVDERIAMLQESLRRFKTVTVTTLSNRYLMDFAHSVSATHILRGIRSASDYEFERAMRHINSDIDQRIGTVFLMPPRGLAEVSSSMVKGLVGPEGWAKVVRKYVPMPVHRRLMKLKS